MPQMTLRRRLFLLLAALGGAPVLALPLLGMARWPALWLLPAVLVLAHAAAGAFARPPESLAETARRLAAGELQARTLVDPHSEWGTIAGAMFGLAERLDQVTRHLEEQVRERTDALARKADQLRAVGEVGQQVAAVLEPDALLHFVVRVLRGTFGYETASVLQRHGEHLVLAACAARDLEETPLGRAFPITGPDAPPLAACIAGEGQISAATSPLVSGLAVRSELAVPVRLGGRVLGILAVQSTRAAAFDAEDLFTVRTIAGQVAVALENARLFAAERQLRDLAITEERNRMAREIHDTLAQGFMGIIMQLRAMQGTDDPAIARFHLEQAMALAEESLQEARRSVWNLRPLPLEGKGLAGALAGEVESLERRAGLSAALETEGSLERLTPAVEAALLRIAQEALHNTLKHARASRVSVRLAVGPDAAELVIADDGVGFAPDAAGALPAAAGGRGPGSGGFGLGGMAERVRLLGGSLTIDSAPGAGCRITARVPVNGRS